jgi:hypothetical protein
VDLDTTRGSRRIIASDLRRVQLSSRFVNRPIVVKADRGHPCLDEWEKVLDCYHRSEYTDPPCVKVLKSFDNCSETLGDSRTYMRELSQLRFHLREMGRKQRQMSFGPPIKA